MILFTVITILWKNTFVCLCSSLSTDSIWYHYLVGKRVGQPIHSFTDKTVSSDFSLSVYLSVCLSNSLSVCLAAFLSACLPVSLSLCHLSVSLSVSLYVCQCVCQSVSQSVCLSVAICLSVYLSHYLSILVYSLVLSHFSFLLMHRPWLRCF